MTATTGAAKNGAAANGAGALRATFPGESEMARHCRAFDWAATPLGPVDGWSPALRAAVRLCLDAGLPGCVYAGDALVMVYNDGFAPILGQKHPGALGGPADVALPEIWSELAPELARVQSAGAPVLRHDARYVLDRGPDGAGAEGFYTFALSPVRDDAGAVVAVHNVVTETTARVRAEAALSAERERLRAVVLAAPAPMALHVGPEHVYALVNDAYRRISGGGRDVTGLPAREAFPEAAGHGLFEVIDRVYATGEGWGAPAVPVRYDRNGAGPEDSWFNLRLEPVRDADGRVTGVLNFSFDVTDQVRARHDAQRLLAESEAAAAQLQEQGLELELSNQQLQNQTVELELQAEELQATAAQLEEQVEAADRAAAALRVSEERYALAARATSNAVWDWDLTTDVVRWSPGVYEAFGYPAGSVEETAAWWYDHIHPDDRERVVAGIHTVIDDPAGGSAWRDSYRYRRGDGSHAEVTDRGYVARDPASGRPLRMVGAMQDVTAERRAAVERERLLAESERARADADAARVAAEAARLRTAALQGVTAALAEARTLDDVAAVVVGPMARAVGARAGSLAVPVPEGDALRLIRTFGFPGALLPSLGVQPLALASPIPECFRTGAPIWAERRDGPDGMDARYPAVAHAWAATGAASGAYLPLAVAGATAGVIGYAFAEPRGFADDERAFLLALARQAAVAAERARLWEAEHAARAAAETANRAKGEFLAVMSHELRTPLNAIGGYAELIELGIHGPVTAEQRTALARVQASQRHLLGLIAGVLDYSRVEAGAVAYQLADVPVTEAVAEAEALVAPQLRAKGLGYGWSGAAPGLCVRADREKLQQVLLNLLSNAVKFTHARGGVPGRVEVACTVEGGGAAAGSGRVRLHVRDTGEGIAAENLERVFEPFVQADQRLTRPHAGVGLGLAISRDLARGMGGELTVESTVGVGSTFTLALPRAPASGTTG